MKTFHCTQCGKSFERLRKDPRSKNIFCSRTCSASHNNSKVPKRSKRKYRSKCVQCGTIFYTRHKRCPDCKYKKLIGDVPLSSVIYFKHHKSSAYAYVRTKAREVAKRLDWKACKHCGYSKHIEIAHVKDIGDFPIETLVSVINSPDNLLPLCPNCHWEFDNSK